MIPHLKIVRSYQCMYVRWRRTCCKRSSRSRRSATSSTRPSTTCSTSTFKPSVWSTSIFYLLLEKTRLPRYSFACHKPSVFLPLSWLTITSSLMTCPTYFCFLPLSWLTLKSSLMACPIYFILFTFILVNLNLL